MTTGTSSRNQKWKGTDLLRNLLQGAGERAGEITGLLGRLEQLATGTTQLFRAQAAAPTDPAVLDALAKGILHQLDRLHAECQQQTITLLSAKEGHDPLMLDVAIYGLSGMREHLDFIIEKFDQALSQSQEQEMRDFAHATPASSGQWGASGVHHKQHPSTRVLREQLMMPKPGLLDNIFHRTPPVHPNELLAQQLIITYREYSRAILEVQQAFRIAQPESLSELSMPIDELRALAERLHKDELTFYSV